jgi:hypothetical protein
LALTAINGIDINSSAQPRICYIKLVQGWRGAERSGEEQRGAERRHKRNTNFCFFFK